MPFLSKDWRSPGEKWVKFEGGWEMSKTLLTTSSHSRKVLNSIQSCYCPENVKHHPDFYGQDIMEVENKENESGYNTRTLPCKRVQVVRRDDGNSCSSSLPSRDPSHLTFLKAPLQPYCPITLKNTKEVAGFNALADCLLRLDFLSAIKDIRRFQFVSKIMYSLFSHEKLFQLPGAAQKILFRMLEEMAHVVYKDNHGEHVLRKLMDELNATMTIYHVWGSHLGSPNLFKQHLETRRRIVDLAEKMQIQYKQDLATSYGHKSSLTPPGLVSTLPEECIREILLRLSDPKDLQNAGKTCYTMETITKEKRVWRELVQTHFTTTQIEYVLKEHPDLKEQKDWKLMYKKLRWRFGLKEEFTETLMLCRKCRVLFWQSLGHPCLVLTSSDDNNNDKIEEDLVPILPQTFLGFFSV